MTRFLLMVTLTVCGYILGEPDYSIKAALVGFLLGLLISINVPGRHSHGRSFGNSRSGGGFGFGWDWSDSGGSDCGGSGDSSCGGD